VPGGGENHPDGVVTMQSMWIDGTPIVKDGALALPELARLEAQLEPLAL
jgi:2,5-dihydroxypyridine 5,6-dioxygenase